MLCNRYANLGGLGFQEKLVLQNKARDALEKGEKPDNVPGMDQAIKDMEAKKVWSWCQLKAQPAYSWDGYMEQTI